MLGLGLTQVLEIPQICSGPGGRLRVSDEGAPRRGRAARSGTATGYFGSLARSDLE